MIKPSLSQMSNGYLLHLQMPVSPRKMRATGVLGITASGAPSDTIPAFTNYLVVGRDVKVTTAYKNTLQMIEAGEIIELIDDALRRVIPLNAIEKIKNILHCIV
jgi:hypothetical protein